jgi:hypothetical protein
MANYAVVNGDGLITNRVVLDDPGAWVPPDGCVAVAETEPMEIGGSYVNGTYEPAPSGPLPPPPPASILSQDLMAQFNADDAGLIRTAVDGNSQFWLLWSALQAQKDPMEVTNTRFLTGWNALIQVLGQERMTQIATALKVTI